MTFEEFEKLHFNFVAHMSLGSVHTRTYKDDSGRLGYCIHTHIKKNFETGRSYIHYRIDENVYKTKDKFVEALADFSFNQKQ
jgi:hypothetical protein